jgi:hypothetical protein
LPTVGAAFVASMEEVLELYQKEYDPSHPVVCLDEKSQQLIAHTRPSLPVQSGQARREDHEYRRQGTLNLFVMVEPKGGYRHLIVRERRTDRDYAQCLKWLVDEGYPGAEYIEIVQDNLNTHKAASLYESFEPEEARRILRKIRFHFTPKHASWLNMAEIEIGVFERSCLRQRLADKATLLKQVRALEAERNHHKATINWQFTNVMARDKLHRLYPILDTHSIAV